MKKSILVLILSLAYFSITFGQKVKRVNKYALGLSLELGYSFPNFDQEQTRWRGSSYPAGGITVLFENKINQNWIVDVGLGLTAYILTNTGPVDKYTLDFASPHLITGIGHHFQNRKRQGSFIKVTTGMQLAYQGRFVDEFETYKVTVQGKDRFYYFIRPEIGIRRNLKKKVKGTRFKMVYEIGVFFRYNLNPLGTAKIEEADFEVTLRPSGNILGCYFKMLFPSGKKYIRLKERIIKAQPIIYNPRNL